MIVNKDGGHISTCSTWATVCVEGIMKWRGCHTCHIFERIVQMETCRRYRHWYGSPLTVNLIFRKQKNNHLPSIKQLACGAFSLRHREIHRQRHEYSSSHIMSAGCLNRFLLFKTSYQLIVCYISVIVFPLTKRTSLRWVKHATLLLLSWQIHTQESSDLITGSTANNFKYWKHGGHAEPQKNVWSTLPQRREVLRGASCSVEGHPDTKHKLVITLPSGTILQNMINRIFPLVSWLWSFFPDISCKGCFHPRMYDKASHQQSIMERAPQSCFHCEPAFD